MKDTRNTTITLRVTPQRIIKAPYPRSDALIVVNKSAAPTDPKKRG